MRTTLTLDSDVARQLKATVRRKKSVPSRRRSIRPCALVWPWKPHPRNPAHFGSRSTEVAFPGLDPHRLNQVADEIEDEAVLSRIRA